MMLKEIIAEEASASKQLGRTSSNLQRLIFHVVSEALTDHYQDNYSTRCFQSSLLIKSLLDNVGIKSAVVLGSLCMPSASGNYPYQLSWRGFWDADHHIWLMTEFLECVDLTVSHIHLHPVNMQANNHLVPPIWWYKADIMPTTIKYLPQKQRPELEADWQEDYNILQQRCYSIFERYSSEPDFRNIGFNNILTDMDNLNSILEAGNHWAQGMLLIDEMNLPLPNWVANRYKELMEPYEQ